MNNDSWLNVYSDTLTILLSRLRLLSNADMVFGCASTSTYLLIIYRVSTRSVHICFSCHRCFCILLVFFFTFGILQIVIIAARVFASLIPPIFQCAWDHISIAFFTNHRPSESVDEITRVTEEMEWMFAAASDFCLFVHLTFPTGLSRIGLQTHPRELSFMIVWINR